MKRVGLFGDFEDAAVIPIRDSELALVKNLDIFTPIIDEPEIAGEIAACNVTNDIFAMNVPEISGGMLVFLAIKTDTPDYIADGILKGIKNFIENKINSKISGGHTIYCEWPLLGGEASGFVKQKDIIHKKGLKKGDLLVLTKPVGLQGVMAAYRILKDAPEMLENYSKTELNKSINLAIKIMTTPSQEVVKAIHSYKDFSFIHSLSDVTGFGLAGHAKEMLQGSNLSITLEKVPSIKLSQSLSSDLGYAFNECKAHETAGGMLIGISKEHSEDFVDRLDSFGVKSWIIGSVNDFKPREVIISKDIEFLEVENI
ncbi:MAG: selenide, water dikinase SelD [Candidatus Lokiarchaeota archaeon]